MNIGIESETVEFKQSLAEQRQGFESICSILNKHHKGTLYFGVKDNGDVCGIQTGKDTLNFLSRDLELYIKPAFWHSIKELHTDDRKTFIEIDFSGTNTPYSAYDRYYLRFADRDKVMSQDMLVNYIQNKKKNYSQWENDLSDCTIDDVDDKMIENYIARCNEKQRVVFKYENKASALKKLGLIHSDNSLNNAGKYLFASKKPISLKFAQFASEKRLTILDMNVFGGNIYECIDAGMSYIKSHINWNVKFDGTSRRIESPEIPMKAIREIVVNAFAHADYEMLSTEFEIDVYSDRVTIYSPGHFPAPYTPEQFAFESLEPIPMNNKICSVLYGDDTIEKYSTGFERTFTLCKESGVKYAYEDTGLGFRFVFYRKNVHGHVRVLSEVDKKVISSIKDKPSLTIKELAVICSKSEKTISRSLLKMKALGIV
ncbi:MAG: putative DNA binding domain-containing protein, partial [Sphaerochaetaceae bacterium]|nr:putative DNA binding domain-containing protein [Sphaerochaetaceae bacterium]